MSNLMEQEIDIMEYLRVQIVSKATQREDRKFLWITFNFKNLERMNQGEWDCIKQVTARQLSIQGVQIE